MTIAVAYLNIFSDALFQRAAGVIIGSAATWIVVSVANYFRAKNLASFLTGEFQEYWSPRTGPEKYMTAITKFDSKIFGPWLSLCPFHNIKVETRADGLDLTMTYYARATKISGMLELDMVDLSTGQNTRYLLTFPPYLNTTTFGGVAIGPSVTGEPMAYPVFFSKAKLTEGDILFLLGGERAVRWVSSEFLSRVNAIRNKVQQATPSIEHQNPI